MEEFLLNLLKGVVTNAASGLTTGEFMQNAFNKRMAEDAFNRQIDYYEKFQSPQALVEQYKVAGINPALVSGYSPSTPPSSAAASGSGGNAAMDAMNMVMQYQLQNKELAIQRDVANADIDLKQAQADESRVRAEGYGIDNYNKQEMYDLQKQSITENINKMKSESKDSFTHAALNNAQAALLKVDYKTRGEINDLRVEILRLQKEYQDYGNEEMRFEIEHLEQTYITQMSQIIAQTNLANAHANQIREYCETMLESPYIDEKGKEHLNRLAAMTDEEITNLRKNNKAKWVSNYIAPLSTTMALTIGAAAGLIKAVGSFKAKGMPVMLNPDVFYNDGSQYGTFDINPNM